MEVSEYALRHGFASTLPQGLRGASTSANNVAVIWEEKMAHVINKVDLPHSGSAYKFEGYLYGDAHVSFFLSETAPGNGPELHSHPYAEVFVVQEGELTFTVGDDSVEASGGQIVIVPAGVSHRFVNLGLAPARHIDIHTSRRMTTEWLEGPKSGDGNGGTTS